MLCSKRRSHVPCLMADSMLGSSEQYRYTLKRMACHLPVCILLFCGSAAVATWAAPAQHRYNLPDDRSLAIGQSAQLVYHLAGRCWPTQFILILNRIKAGQGNTAGELERLETKAQDEGFVDVLLGSNCYTSAVRSVKQDCNAMDSDSSMWLAFSMANCLFAKTGRHTYPCKSSALHEVASCIGQMNGDDYVRPSHLCEHSCAVGIAESSVRCRLCSHNFSSTYTRCVFSWQTQTFNQGQKAC